MAVKNWLLRNKTASALAAAESIRCPTCLQWVEFTDLFSLCPKDCPTPGARQQELSGVLAPPNRLGPGDHWRCAKPGCSRVHIHTAPKDCKQPFTHPPLFKGAVHTVLLALDDDPTTLQRAHAAIARALRTKDYHPASHPLWERMLPITTEVPGLLPVLGSPATYCSGDGPEDKWIYLHAWTLQSLSQEKESAPPTCDRKRAPRAQRLLAADYVMLWCGAPAALSEPKRKDIAGSLDRLWKAVVPYNKNDDRPTLFLGLTEAEVLFRHLGPKAKLPGDLGPGRQAVIDVYVHITARMIELMHLNDHDWRNRFLGPTTPSPLTHKPFPAFGALAGQGTQETGLDEWVRQVIGERP